MNLEYLFRFRLLALPLLTLLIYLPALGGGFVFDDFSNVVNNPRVHLVTFDLQSVWESLWSWQGRFSRPVSYLSFAINHYFSGLSPFWFKLTGLLIHITNGFLIYALVRTWLAESRSASASNIAFFVALLWLVHPVNVSTAVYVVQRMTALSALFVLCGLLLFLAWRKRVVAGNSPVNALLLGVALCAGLAFLSKENGILLFAFIAVTEYFLRRSGNMPRSGVTAVVGYLPFAGLAFAAFLVLAIAPERLVNYDGRPFTLWERLLTEPRVLFFYIENIIAPDLRSLGLFLDDFRLSTSPLAPWTTMPAITGLTALAVTAFAGMRRFPLAAFGVLFFLAGHLLESTFIALEIAFEHRNYLPGVGILLAVAALLDAAFQTAVVRRILPALCMLTVAVFAASTWVRASSWENPLLHAFFEVTHHPHSPRANAEYGRLLMLAADRAPSDARSRQLLALAKAHLASSVMEGRFSREGSYNLISLHYSAGNISAMPEIDALNAQLASGFITHVDVKGLNMLVDCRLADHCAVPHAQLQRLISSALSNARLHGVWRAKLLLVAAKLHSHQGRRDEAVRYAARAAEIAGNIRSVPVLIEVARFNGNNGNDVLAKRMIAIAERIDRWGIYGEALSNAQRAIHE